MYVRACNSNGDKWEMHIKQKGEYIHHAGWKKASLEHSGKHRGI